MQLLLLPLVCAHEYDLHKVGITSALLTLDCVSLKCLPWKKVPHLNSTIKGEQYFGGIISNSQCKGKIMGLERGKDRVSRVQLHAERRETLKIA